ncbi:hypothetical protein CHARACLAT_006543 [Characodon lateralis]|uniref:Uncharacterized protein n=1 Tax=Characodon lateralis TaxID=208331 RepID=A0ABU7DQU1_9TELE|nr:hypothetical protein [Characodon lateralis]
MNIKQKSASRNDAEYYYSLKHTQCHNLRNADRAKACCMKQVATQTYFSMVFNGAFLPQGGNLPPNHISNSFMHFKIILLNMTDGTVLKQSDRSTVPTYNL